MLTASQEGLLLIKLLLIRGTFRNVHIYIIINIHVYIYYLEIWSTLSHLACSLLARSGDMQLRFRTFRRKTVRWSLRHSTVAKCQSGRLSWSAVDTLLRLYFKVRISWIKNIFYECIIITLSLLRRIIADGEPIVHKTFHSYTVRAKQGFAQNSRTNGNHAKSAGASLRRYNEASLIQVYFQEYRN